MPAMQLVRATVLVTAFAAVFLGCTTDPTEADRDPCARKAGACHNTCYKADLGEKCHACCDDNGSSCANDGGYRFYSCPDKE